MESRYGIGINNRYALFIDQDDMEDEAILKKAAEAAKKAKEVKLKEKEMLPPAPANKETKAPVGNHQVSANAKKNETGKPEDKENRNRDLDARKVHEGPQESRTRVDRNNRRNRPATEDDTNQNVPSRVSHETPGQRNGEGRRGGRGSRGAPNSRQVGERWGERDRGERRERQEGPEDWEGRNARGGGGGRRGKRDFDRKSGDNRTGVKATDKREGGGLHNWGTFNEEIKNEEDKANITNIEVPEAADENKSDEPKVMTLDEWKKQQGERSGLTFNLRKAGEGSEIDPKWMKTIAYKKERENHEDDEDHELYPQRVNRQRHLMDIEINFGEGNRGGATGGRGGRGGGRDRPRGERRGGRGGPGAQGQSSGKPRGRNAEAPNVNDEQSFPSLG